MLQETNWKTVQETDFQVSVLPWGATEAHNLHLPYGTDNMQLDRIAADACAFAWDQGAWVIALPTVPFGVNTGQTDIKLDLNMMPSTQQALMHDPARVLEQQGIPKLVILNGHGGNDFRQIIREVGVHFPRLFISEMNRFKALDPTHYFHNPGDHAGELETSLLLEIAPELVLPLMRQETGVRVHGKSKNFMKDGPGPSDAGVRSPTIPGLATLKELPPLRENGFWMP